MPEPTPEQLGREAGEAIANAIADNLEAVIMRLVDSIATLQAEQAEIRDTQLAERERVNALVRAQNKALDAIDLLNRRLPPT